LAVPELVLPRAVALATPESQAANAAFLLWGCDFSSSPSQRKPVVLATGELRGAVVVLHAIETLPTLHHFSAALHRPGPWVGAFDLPFGLPRELVTALGWPTQWPACMAHYAALSRDAIRARFAAFCDARAPGHKLAHRATDGPAGSSPSMKWVNPPVAFMLHAGVPRLLEAGVSLPGLCQGDPLRIALEAYPGLLAREVLARRSYKADDAARQTPERWLARRELLESLVRGTQVDGRPLRSGLRLRLKDSLADTLLQDPRGDALDATLCLMQAGWALAQHKAGHPQWGLPVFDPLEGWIVTAGAAP
jgi:hypothetical protein